MKDTTLQNGDTAKNGTPGRRKVFFLRRVLTWFASLFPLRVRTTLERPVPLPWNREFIERLLGRVHTQTVELASLNAVFEAMSDVVIVADSAGKIIRFNKGAEELFEIDAASMTDAALGENLPRLIGDQCTHGKELSAHMASMRSVRNCRTEIIGLSGKRTPVLLSIDLVHVEGQISSIVLVIKDNSALEAAHSDLKDMYQELESLSRTDHLTGLANRREFDMKIRDEFERMKRGHNKELSLLFLDIDHFKNFNTKFGHQVGDEVLRLVGQVLKSRVRVIDTAARYGGEEFAIVLPATDEAGAVMLAERIRQRISEIRVPIGQDKDVSVTASIGTRTNRPKDPETLEIFIRHANVAMLHAKESGRDRVVQFERVPELRSEQ